VFCVFIIIVYYARRQRIIQIKHTTLHTSKTIKASQKASHQSTDEAKLHHTAFLIDTSYELISYFAPVAIKQLYFRDDNVISITLSQRRIFGQKIIVLH